MSDEHSTAGKTVLMCLWDIKADIYFPTFRSKLIKIIQEAGMTVLDDHAYHWQAPQYPFTLSLILEESSCVAEWWPEKNYMAVSIYTCGSAEPMNIAKAINEWLRPEYEQITQQIRGVRNLYASHP